jgi:Raf kinase inhibitor-like YbhB/YbcL family protein
MSVATPAVRVPRLRYPRPAVILCGTVITVALLAPAPAIAQRAVTPRSGRFSVTSPDLAQGGRITDAHVFNSFGCTGQNISPTLRWSGAPPGTRSFAVTAYDPDAPTGSGWWHWVIYNIPASVTELPAGAGDPRGTTAPAGSVQGNTDFGAPGYGGPCPPKGDRPHRYIFTVFALETDKLDLPANATAAFVGFNLHANTLAKGTLMARYGR